MDEDRISLRSWDTLERSLPTYMQESPSNGRVRRTNRKSLIVRYHDDDGVDVDDQDSDDDDESQQPDVLPGSSSTPIFIPVPATATVTITATAAAATPQRDCYLDGQDSTTSPDVYACTRYKSSPSDDHQSSALQTDAEKAGLVVALTVGLSMIVFLIAFLTLRRKYGPGFTLWSCLTRRKKSSEFDREWAKLSDGEDGPVWPDKLKARPVTITVQELDAGLVETARNPSLQERESESNTSEKASENTAHAPVLTIETKSSGSWRTENEKELPDLMRESESEYESPPAAKRRPWMSYFSWSTAPTTPACSSHRETIMTDDSEPPRFRSITSWVNHQSERQQRQTSGVVLLPPPIVARRSKFNGHPPYPPTPPIPRQTSVDEEEKPRLSSFLESPSPRTTAAAAATEDDRLPQQPAKAITPSTRHNSVRSSVSTLPVFRAHPGEEVDIGQQRRIHSSSLRWVMGDY